MSSRKKEKKDHFLEMTESPMMNHQQTDPVILGHTQQPNNSGYDSDPDLAEVASQHSRSDPNRPGGPYSSEVVKHDPLPPPAGKFYNLVHNTQTFIYSFWNKHKKFIKRIVLLILLVGYFVFLGFAVHRSVQEATGLIVITSIFCAYFTYKILLEKHWQRCRVPCCHYEWWQVSSSRARAITVIKW